LSLFRGEPAHVWIRRLEQRGWPYETAVAMARFLTEKGTPPAWQEMAAQLPAPYPEPLPRQARSG
jgi:hypothetical protein